MGVAKVTHGLTIHCDLKLSNNLRINWGVGQNFHITEHLTASCSDDLNIDQKPPVAPLDTLVGTGRGSTTAWPATTSASRSSMRVSPAATTSWGSGLPTLHRRRHPRRASELPHRRQPPGALRPAARTEASVSRDGHRQRGGVHQGAAPFCVSTRRFRTACPWSNMYGRADVPSAPGGRDDDDSRAVRIHCAGHDGGRPAAGAARRASAAPHRRTRSPPPNAPRDGSCSSTAPRSGWRGYKIRRLPAGWASTARATQERRWPTSSRRTSSATSSSSSSGRIGEAGNSGIFYRGSEEYDRIYWTAPEYQLLDDLKRRGQQDASHVRRRGLRPVSVSRRAPEAGRRVEQDPHRRPGPPRRALAERLQAARVRV